MGALSRVAVHVRGVGPRRLHARPRAGRVHPVLGLQPAVSRLAHATDTRAALRRGAKLIVVDPRRAGFAAKAEPWLRVRPGTDAALALAITNVMIERGWYDEPFVRRWTNGPLLVRTDTGRLLRASDLAPDGDSGHHVAWDEVAGHPVVLDPAARGTDVGDHDHLALAGAFDVPTVDGTVACRPAFDLVAEQCRATSPAVAEEITGVPAAEIERAAQRALEPPPGRVLHVERPRAAQRHDPDHPSDQRAVRADRLPRRPRRKCLVHARAGEPNRRGGTVGPGAAGEGHRGRRPAARPGPIRVHHRRGLLHGGARGPSLPARVGW